MKLKYIIAIFIATALFSSCNKEEIGTYNTLTQYRYLSFVKAESSESNVSFYKYPGQETINFPIEVKSTGFGETEMEYKVSVVKDSTTATETDFTLPQSFKFQPKSAIDTFYVQLHYSEKLDTEQLKLTLQIEPNENFKEGEEAYLMSVIVFHNNLVKPEWWSTTYFGTYTNLKYKYFLQVIQKDLTDVDNSTKRHYALMFKAWLEEQAAAGSPIKEEDGTLMTIPAGGGNK